jgi:cyclopropane-fatty-acyl-phospholipid synthase
MNTTIAPEIESSVGFLGELFDGLPPENISFRLWDGTSWPDAKPRSATIVLKHPGALRGMFESGTEKGLAEAYLRDDFDVAGDIESAFSLADAFGARSSRDWRRTVSTYYRFHRLPAARSLETGWQGFREKTANRHSRERDRQAVSFHYDVSNDFFRLWLDGRMLYSCGYFERPDDDLDRAQTAKLRQLCRKLRLRPGQRVLDIGCGWGGFAIFAARHCEVAVTGVTLSRQQAELATAFTRAAGVERQVKIEQRDYRELPESETFDAIVSVGMSEHVGTDQLRGYFKTAGKLLRPGGVFLNHAIGEGVRPRARRGPSFIDEYVFPDSDIPPVPTVLHAAEAAGFEVRDVENLREHYTLTLRHWVRRLEAAHEAALNCVNETTYRCWRLYMAGSARGFDRAHLAIYQALLSKPDPEGRSHLPLTRRDWYEQS